MKCGHPLSERYVYRGRFAYCRRCRRENREKRPRRATFQHFPWAPLETRALAVLGARSMKRDRRTTRRNDNYDPLRASRAQVAALFGVSERQITRWKSAGIPLYSADRAAVALGVHPVELWPDFHALEPVSAAAGNTDRTGQ